ncbi:MAG: protein of Unknown Function containing DUF748 domain [Marinobacter excellens HL-55]|uniref:DUF748 domain-containing protein n=1 Tax=Marinobacter excellens HL-55 TaxID=1305731 RepID=A0A0P7Z7P3_9GAMM|nr:MAG: protein of Unknown Function containing DUF748 domain [Marinobacter excellens HL-55]
MAQSRQRSRLPRNLAVAVLILIVLYALAGFLALPWWLKRALPEQLDEQMGWQAELAELRVNPFSLTVEATQLSANDRTGEKVLGFDRLFVNLGFFQLFRGIVSFQATHLQEPYIRVDLLGDYSVNFARDWQAAQTDAAQTSAPVAEAESGTPPKLFFQQLTIDGGELLFRDFSQSEPAEFRVTPLDLSIDDLATWPRDAEGSQYSVIAALGDQTIEWQGELSITPLFSEGRLKISDLDHSTLGHFLAPYLPWQLRDGSLTVESRYQLGGTQPFELITSDGKVTVQNLAVALADSDDEPALAARTIEFDGIGFDLTAAEARVGAIILDQPFVAAARDREGMIDWIASLTPAEPEANQDEQPEADEPAFRWSVQGVEVAGGRLRWRDQVPDTPAELELTDLEVTLGGLSHLLDEPVTYGLDAVLASGGRISANGQLTPAPFTLEAALSGSDVTLAVIEPYLQQTANLALASGRLGFDGNLDLDSQDDPMTGTFSGSAEIVDLDLRLPDSDASMLGWQTLRLAPIEFNVTPPRLEIGTVTLAQPSFTAVRMPDGLHNFEQIMRAASNEDEVAGEAASAPSDAEPTEPGFIFRIGELQVEDGAVDYSDRTLDPPFSARFDDLKGSVTGVSNVPPQQGRVNLRGRLAGDAPVTFEGSLGALGTDESSALSLSMEDLSLPVLSPYFGRYLGYAVDSGKLKLNLDYEFTGTRLKASNQVTLDRMALGQAVASDQAVGAPVKLGLALLTDRRGVIEVDLPIQGDVSDPEFSVGQIVMRAFVNLLVSAATSPFSMLGSLADLAGFSSEELGQVSFVPGQVALAEGEADKLVALAKALNERPELLLNIRGGIAPEADSLALLRARMEARGEPVTDDAWAQVEQAWRDGERELPPEQLGQLASERGQTIRRLLLNTHDVAADQLFTLEPTRQATVDEQGDVTVQFTLDVR